MKPVTPVMLTGGARGSRLPELALTLAAMDGEPARRTKIIGTLGPSSASRDRIADLVRAGMDCARLNFSHGTREQHAAAIEAIREVQEEAGRPLAIIADLQGPKLRLGALDPVVLLERGEHVDVIGGNGTARRDGELT